MSNEDILNEIRKQVEMNTDSVWIYNLDLSEMDITEEILGGRDADSSELKFDSCNLNEIPEAVFYKTGINSLNFINNKITDIPEKITKLKYLTDLPAPQSLLTSRNIVTRATE